MAQQARVVLRDTALEQGEKLLEVTRLGSLTELINVMFSRYGSHLEQTWEVKAVSPTYAQPEPSPEMPEPIEPPNDFTFNQPITGL
ncbi:hypothetical protein [Coleofasciculus sp. E1-EBD-02]|uniref:hypothetical protein n=1 Tax=Coleofasciculus sp. E1-EBD-02 TaxID=3068481 RepID=UPI003301010E